MTAPWIDFKALRASLTFEQVLRHYNVEVKAKGRQHHGYCPLPKHEGKKNSVSFSANLDKGIFQCFGCKAKGNLLDFAVLMENGDPKSSADVRKTAIGLHETFGGTKAEKPKDQGAQPPPAKRENTTVVVNAPLDFELKTLDFNHPYLRGRGFTNETIHLFGLGFCSKGYHARRIAIPLHDKLGRLIGYAGRIVDDKLVSETNPRYKLPGERERKGVTYEFRKSEFLYWGYRIKEPVDELIVVEGFPSVWWLTQHSIANVVSLMGSSMSEAQAKLVASLVAPSGRVWLVPDGNKAGVECAESALPLIAAHRFVRWVNLEPGKQPTDYEGDRFRALLNQ